MSNLNRFVAAVAHITDFPIEESDHLGNNSYLHNGASLVASEEGNLITVSVISRAGQVYMLRAYGGCALYHNTLKRAIKLDSKTCKWITYDRDTAGLAFTNLYDAMKHCGGTHGWI